MIALAIAFAMTPSGPDFSHAPRLKLIFDIGSASFALMLSVLAGYIAYSIAGRPGLVPGFIGGYFSPIDIPNSSAISGTASCSSLPPSANRASILARATVGG